jgi:eukaryotic-like serine/threonine-protein kinase
MSDLSEPFIDPLVGHRLGDYAVSDRIGEGGICVVYRAVHQPTGREVALKVLRRTWVDDAQTPKRFLREARISASLTNPNTVTVYESGEADGTLYLAMELLEGESLASLLRRRQLPPVRTAAILEQVCLSLIEAHGKGVVHRDLKPENIFVSRRPDGAQVVKVLDYGLARVSEGRGQLQVHTVLTRIGTIMGTPAYMSPEQARGEPVDARTDLYSIGVILFEMLAGHRPFVDPNPHRLIERLKAEPVPAMQADGVPPRLEALARRLLAKDPDERPGEARAVLEELRAFRGEPGTAGRQAESEDTESDDERTEPELSRSLGEGALEVVSERDLTPAEHATLVLARPPDRPDTVPSLARMLEPTPASLPPRTPRTLWVAAAVVIGILAAGVAMLPGGRRGPTRSEAARAPHVPAQPRPADRTPAPTVPVPTPVEESSPAAALLPEGAPRTPWAGTFHCERGPLKLLQRGDRVTGFFGTQTDFGRLWGKVEGDGLEFRWALSGAEEDPQGRGKGRLHLLTDARGTRLEGTFGYGDRVSGGGPWTAVRVPDAPQ